MIINHEGKWIYLANPKTGTRSVIRWIEEHWPYVEKIGAPACHNTDIPSNCKEYWIWSTVRNPYARAVSFWRSTVVRGDGKNYNVKEQCIKHMGGCTLEDLMALVCKIPRHERGNRLRIGHWAALSQDEYFGAVQPNMILRQEAYPDCLHRLPFTTPVQVATFPHLNRSDTDTPQKPEWEDYLTPRVIRLVDRWANFDFPRFGYPRLRPCAFSREGGRITPARA